MIFANIAREISSREMLSNFARNLLAPSGKASKIEKSSLKSSRESFEIGHRENKKMSSLENFCLERISYLVFLPQFVLFSHCADIKDAFQFGFHAYETNYPAQSKSWMEEVLRLLDVSDHKAFDFSASKARFQALDLLSWAEFKVWMTVDHIFLKIF